MSRTNTNVYMSIHITYVYARTDEQRSISRLRSRKTSNVLDSCLHERHLIWLRRNPGHEMMKDATCGRGVVLMKSMQLLLIEMRTTDHRIWH